MADLRRGLNLDGAVSQRPRGRGARRARLLLTKEPDSSSERVREGQDTSLVPGYQFPVRLTGGKMRAVGD